MHGKSEPSCRPSTHLRHCAIHIPYKVRQHSMSPRANNAVHGATHPLLLLNLGISLTRVPVAVWRSFMCSVFALNLVIARNDFIIARRSMICTSRAGPCGWALRLLLRRRFRVGSRHLRCKLRILGGEVVHCSTLLSWELTAGGRRTMKGAISALVTVPTAGSGIVVCYAPFRVLRYGFVRWLWV